LRETDEVAAALADAAAARETAERKQRLLMREVDHRAKNALTVVQTIVRLTRAEQAAELVAAVEGRVSALAQAHTLLAAGRWEGADLRQLAAAELAAFGGDDGRVELVGPPALLAADAVQPMGMLLHELATNAVKHGALSVAGGCVRLSWRPADAGGLRLEWREEGGPIVTAAGAGGVGSTLIRAVTAQMEGTASFDWRPEGVCCTVTVTGVLAPSAGTPPAC
jgi:two-component sensor histidine kinase